MVDANVLLSALLRDGSTRHALLATDASCFAPARLRDEVDRHVPDIMKRSGLSKEDFDVLLRLALARIRFVPDAAIRPYLVQAAEILPPGAGSDAPYLACAMAVNADGIWTFDRDFDGQDLIDVVRRPTDV